MTLPVRRGSSQKPVEKEGTEKPILPVSRRIPRPNDSRIDGKNSILIYKTRSNGNSMLLTLDI
jgi:hypothetical protein